MPVMSVKKQNSIKMVCVGGFGCNVAKLTIKQCITCVEIVAAHTEVEMLKQSEAHTLVQIGNRSDGSGLRPNIVRMLAEESSERIREALLDSSIVVIVAGLGGGTGTGASPVFAQVAKRMGAYTIAVVTTPFSYEGREWLNIADMGIDELSNAVDLLFVLSNQKMESLDEDSTLLEWLMAANAALLATVLSAIATANPSDATLSYLRGNYQILAGGMVTATGIDRIRIALESAFASPFFKNIENSAIDLMLISIETPSDLSESEFNHVITIAQEHGSSNSLCRLGIRRVTNIDDAVNVSVAAFSKRIANQHSTEWQSAKSSVSTKEHDTKGDVHARNFVKQRRQD